jgi:hypothetical protein
MGAADQVRLGEWHRDTVRSFLSAAAAQRLPGGTRRRTLVRRRPVPSEELSAAQGGKIVAASTTPHIVASGRIGNDTALSLGAHSATINRRVSPPSFGCLPHSICSTEVL